MRKSYLALAFAGVTVIAGTKFGYEYGTIDRDVTFTVTDKERITESYACGDTESPRTCTSSKYLIFTERADTQEVETFENTDSTLHLKFNSSDIYGKLKRDCSYKADVYGWRIGFLSQYRNIIDVEEVSCNNNTPQNTFPKRDAF